ncbi:MAG: hypothetical protein Q8N39_06140 [Pelolinea sp.]|nr:hypothetical protein [Pelolinea sp.]
MFNDNFQDAISKAGDYLGRHYSTYVEEVKDLKRKGDVNKLEHLLYKLVEATEAQDMVSNYGVAPWYYEELAKYFRKKKDYQSEVAILTRYSIHQLNRRPCTKTPILLKRLERAKELLAKTIKIIRN